MESEKKSVLFVCLANICRSPIAEAVFTKLVNDRHLADHWIIDSAGTSDCKVGNSPDFRGVLLLKKKGIPIRHKARQITTQDFFSYDYILAMDTKNMRYLKRMTPLGSTAKVKLLGSYDPVEKTIIPDPFGGKESDFENVYKQCVIYCQAFLDDVDDKLSRVNFNTETAESVSVKKS